MSYSFTSFSKVSMASIDSVLITLIPIVLANSKTLRDSASSLLRPTTPSGDRDEAMLCQLRFDLRHCLRGGVVVNS